MLRRSSLLGLAMLVWVAGCSVPVAADLDEADANQILLALERHGVAARKLSDPAGDGRWQVTVPNDDAASALRLLQQEALPAPATPGVLDALDADALVPSRAAEHARLVTGIAGDLERTLAGLPRVVSARVHLAVPLRAAWDASPPALASAAVLIRYRGDAPPVDADEVRRLVAGAVTDLSPTRVAVVVTPTPVAERGASPPLAHLGPIAVARSSLLPLRVLIGAAVGLNLLLIALVLALWARVRRQRSSPEPDAS